jgi:hypothetical protein
MVFLLIVLALVWVGLQLARARLLGRAVRVSSATFPELQALLDSVRHQLDYDGRVDIYVIDKAEHQLSHTSYLGTRIILIEGALAAELLEPSKRPQLVFLLGREMGALKAKHARLEAVLVLLEAAGALQLVKPFVLPYYRTISYSGDQIGLACCGNLDAGLEATGRLLVGKELAPDLPLAGVVPQAALVRHNVLPRFAQFLSAEPHATNRYLNLLTYGRPGNPATWDRLRESLDPTGARQLDEIWLTSPHRLRAAQPPPPPPPPPPPTTAVRAVPPELNYPPPHYPPPTP